MNDRIPTNRAQRRAENKKNQIRLKQEQQQKIKDMHSAITKNPSKKNKIEKSYRNFNGQKVLFMTIAIMIAFFILLGIIFYPMMS